MVKAAAPLDPVDEIRVGIYVRRSTDEENQPYSLEMQETRLEAYVGSQERWRIVKRFEDNASGATVDKRTGLQRAMKAARAGLIDVLLVYKVDRFSRNLRDAVTLLDELDSVGVVFRSATEPFDTATPMGRMLLQMLSMFAQFERDLIVERVLGGMMKAAEKGRWKGGKRPFGYLVDKSTQKLVPHDNEAVVVQLMFDLYTRDRLGAKAIAYILNERGYRNTAGGIWYGEQILRKLCNRVYIGENEFRGILVEDAHPAIVRLDVFEEAQRILEQRGESYAHRAASDSDYIATGLMQCPNCGKAMLGTRATGKTKTYRYYTCFTRARHGVDKCSYPRLNADSLDQAVLDAVVSFYQSQYRLITEAVKAAQAQYDCDNDTKTAELAAVQADLFKTQAAIDRYLDAFENGKLDEDQLAGRVNKLNERHKQLRWRRDHLRDELDNQPVMPDRSTLDEVHSHINSIFRAGNNNQRKAVIETLVAGIKILAPDRIVPVFRIPQPDHEEGAEPGIAESSPSVRTMTTLVELRGFEPLPPHCQSGPKRTLISRNRDTPAQPGSVHHRWMQFGRRSARVGAPGLLHHNGCPILQAQG
ncbi:recombinase family protein [Kibdelosporangium banguiense]|nr:recombinase family protein [Kibdelosporangium banguiense]